MRRRIELLPPAMQHEVVYRREDHGRAFLALEHEAQRVIRGRWDFMPGDDVPDSKYEVFYEENDEEDDDEMEDMPPAAVKLVAVLPDNYGEDAAMAIAMAASLADEEARWSWPGLEDII
jgi:hypothetical protein